MPARQRVTHPLEPVFDARSRALVLGTMPSPKSREQGFFYGHPHNRFWRVLAAVLEEPLPQSVEEKRAMLLRRGIALWDVLQRCDIDGASDASIRHGVPNDFSCIFRAADIRAVFTTGQTAARLYRRFTGADCICLPSPSPANCRVPFDELTAAYRAILPYLPPAKAL